MLEEKDIIRLFTDIGCNKHILDGQVIFEKDGTYYRLTLLKSQNAYVIETAESFDEAQKNRFEDDDIVEITTSADETYNKLREVLGKYYC